MPRSFLRTTLPALGFFALAALSAHGEEDATPAGPPLLLNDVVVHAVQKNFNVTIGEYGVTEAVESLNVAKAGFEPVFNASTQRNLTQNPASINILDGTGRVGQRNDTTTTQIGVTQLIPQTGATVSVNTNLGRSATNSVNVSLNPSFTDSASLTVTQPLLKGAGSTVARANLHTAKLGVDIAQLTHVSSILQTIHDTEEAYYALVYARENRVVLKHSLDLAQALFDENQIRKQTGVATDIDVLTAQVGVENARLSVVQSEQTVKNNEDSLLNLIGPTDFNTRVGAVSFPELADKTPPKFDLSYKLALDSSPTYLTTLATIKQIEITVAVTKQNRLPTLNLTGALGYSAIDDSYGDVVATLPNNHGNNWSLGLNYSMPWGLDAGRAQYRSAIASLNQQKVELDQLLQNLVVSVRADVRAVEVAFTSVEISERATALSEKEYELAKARFDAGLATSRDVLQAQTDLETARISALQSQVNLRNALANLHQLEGSSITRYKIHVAGP
jgi:outer membrane protein